MSLRAGRADTARTRADAALGRGLQGPERHGGIPARAARGSDLRCEEEPPHLQSQRPSPEIPRRDPPRTASRYCPLLPARPGRSPGPRPTLPSPGRAVPAAERARPLGPLVAWAATNRLPATSEKTEALNFKHSPLRPHFPSHSSGLPFPFVPSPWAPGRVPPASGRLRAWLLYRTRGLPW